MILQISGKKFICSGRIKSSNREGKIETITDDAVAHPFLGAFLNPANRYFRAAAEGIFRSAGGYVPEIVNMRVCVESAWWHKAVQVLLKQLTVGWVNDEMIRVSGLTCGADYRFFVFGLVSHASL
jgi:hypothetical protein